MADNVDDSEERDFLVVGGQTAGVAAYLRWKDKAWPDRQGGTRKKDFLDGYAAALHAIADRLGREGPSIIEEAVRGGRL